MSLNPPEVVVITGASAGVGRATAAAFAKRGAQIGLLARGTKGLEATRQSVEELGGHALVLPVDVADPQQVEAAAVKVEQRFGPIDIWINNAMTSVFSPLKAMLPEEFLRVTEVTYLGAVYGTMSALKRMLPRDRGTIVQVGSALAYRSIPLQGAYCGAKAAIRGFTDSLRSELIHDRSQVRVTVVDLPGVNTPQFSWVKSRLPRQAQPIPPVYQPEVAAEAIYWAAHHRRRRLIVGFSTLKAIVANKLFPKRLDRYLSRKAYSGQQTNLPQDPSAPDNLWQPLDGEDGRDYGAHGRFDARARGFSPALWLSKHRLPLGLAAATLAGFALASQRNGVDAENRLT